jgi:hypothetical protein
MPVTFNHSSGSKKREKTIRSRHFHSFSTVNPEFAVSTTNNAGDDVILGFTRQNCPADFAKNTTATTRRVGKLLSDVDSANTAALPVFVPLAHSEIVKKFKPQALLQVYSLQSCRFLHSSPTA